MIDMTSLDDSRQIARVLRMSPVISALSEGARLRIAATCVLEKPQKESRRIQLPITIPRACFVIVGFGLVKSAFLIEPKHTEFIVGLAGPGETIEMEDALQAVVDSRSSDVAPVGRMPMRHSLVTDTVTLLYVKAAAVLSELSERSQAGVALALECGRAKNRMRDRLLAVVHSSAEARVAQTMLDLQERFGDDNEDGSAFIAIHFGRSELASLAGVSNETAIRILSVWAKRGLVTDTAEGGIAISSLEELRKVGAGS